MTLSGSRTCVKSQQKQLIKSPTEAYLRTLSKSNHQEKRKIRDGTHHDGSLCVSVFWHQVGTIRVVATTPIEKNLEQK